MKNLFNSIQLSKPGTNLFDLSHDVKLSFNMGQLVPIMCTEAVPGDRFKIGCESLLRFAPLISPVMHRMDVTMHYFFVPNRLVWDGWEDFITGGVEGGDPEEFPYLIMDEDTYTPLCDYLGIPIPLVTQNELVSALPFAAYQMIYNEYYRDQNLINEVDFHLVPGNNTVTNPGLLTLRKRAWEHDYFTAALPFAQKNGAVDIPLGDVQLKDNWDGITGASGTKPHFQDATGGFNAGTVSQNNIASNPHILVNNLSRQAYDPQGTLETTPTTINDLRRAFRLQEWLEKAARGGSRYIESILSHFGVQSSDKRLQRPEYITGIKSPVQISEVLNTSDTTDAPQGNMAGHAVAFTQGKYGGYRCEEHGYIMGIMSVMPKTAYQQGIPKHFTKRFSPFQYYWPSFANIGEQAVENREIYAYQLTAIGDATFGYVPRYAEYKFENSRVAGDFRTSLDFWHLGRKFATPPSLNQTFIEVDSANTDRIFAVTDPDEQKLYCQVYNHVTAVRPMPKFGTPTF